MRVGKLLGIASKLLPEHPELCQRLLESLSGLTTLANTGAGQETHDAFVLFVEREEARAKQEFEIAGPEGAAGPVPEGVAPDKEGCGRLVVNKGLRVLQQSVEDLLARKAQDGGYDNNEADRAAGGAGSGRLFGKASQSIDYDDMVGADGKVVARGVSEKSNTDPAQLPWFPSPSHGGMRTRIFILFDDSSQSVMGKVIMVAILLTIVVSTVSFVLESMPEFRYRLAECQELRTAEACEPRPGLLFGPIEVACIAIFTVDYLARMATVHSLRNEEDSEAGTCNGILSGIWKTFWYARAPLNVIDFLAIMPFYLDIITGGATKVLKVLRLARVIRLFKAAKHHEGMVMFAEVMAMSGQPLAILLFFNCIIIVLFASVIYYAEGTRYSIADKFTAPLADLCGNLVAPRFPTGVYVRENAQLSFDEVSPFRTIPYAVWWVSVTMTTVGYGDYSPATRLGKIIGVLCFYVGIIFLALPISILGTNFEIVYERFVEKRKLSKEQSEAERPASPKKKKKPSTPPAGRKSVATWKEMGYVPTADNSRKRIFLLFEDPGASKISRYYSFLMILTILISTAAFIMESMPAFRETPDDCLSSTILTVENCEPQPLPIFMLLETVCVIMFTVDYIARASCVHTATPEECGLDPDQRVWTPLKVTLYYCLQWLNLIDLAAVMPFYVEMLGIGQISASWLRVLRLIRVFRVLKMPRLRSCADMFLNIVMDALPALGILFFMTTLTCVFFASCIVHAEGTNYQMEPRFFDDYPDGLYIRPTKDGYDIEPTPFRSILYAFWWFFTTATTVGYGDDYPTTTAGRIVGVITFYSGIVLLALPITIVGGSFTKFYPVWVAEWITGPAKERARLEGRVVVSPRNSRPARTSRMSMNIRPQSPAVPESLAQLSMPRMVTPPVSPRGGGSLDLPVSSSSPACSDPERPGDEQQDGPGLSNPSPTVLVVSPDGSGAKVAPTERAGTPNSQAREAWPATSVPNVPRA